MEGGLPGRVLPDAGLEDVADDHFIDALHQGKQRAQRFAQNDRGMAESAVNSARPPRYLPMGVRTGANRTTSGMTGLPQDYSTLL